MTGPWHDLTGRARLALPPRVRGWVAHPGSMTAKVGEQAGAPVSVEVLRQGPGRMLPDERPLLPPAPGSATIREVCLSAGGRPLLVARTAFASRRLATHPTILALGDRPLGSLLFAEGRPNPHSARQFAHLGPDAPLFALIRRRHRGLAQAYWARRTLYLLFGEPLLVTEIFLPDLLHRPEARRAFSRS